MNQPNPQELENQKEITKHFELYLQSIINKWNAPADFWTEHRSFALDSFVLKSLLKEAFEKGANVTK